MSKAKKILIVVILLLAVGLIGGSMYTVHEDEYAAVLQFGRIVRVDNTAGLKMKVPFVQSVTYIPKSIQMYDTAASDVITQDKKSMICDNYILWKVTDPVRFTQTLSASRSMAEDRAGVAAYNATKNIISSMSQDQIIESRGERLTALITNDANANMGNYGMQILKVEIKALDLPEDNKEAVYERMISERNNIAASYEAEGRAEAQKIRNETDRRVAVMIAQAKKDAAILEAEGEQEYMQILAAAYSSKDKAEFYNYLRGLDSLKDSLKGSGGKTILLDRNSELAKVLYGEG